MVGRGRRSQRRNGIVNVVLRQRDDVHIPFDDQKTRWFRVILLRFIKAVQLAALWKISVSGEFRYFGRIVTQHATTKTNYPASLVADREHHPFAEAVVVRPWSLVTSMPASISDFRSRIAAKTF
jgi:hypothetical protein